MMQTVKTPAPLAERLPRLALFTLAVAACGWWSTHMALGPLGFSMLWIPSGILFGVLLTSPRGHWPAYLACALLAFLASNLQRNGAGLLTLAYVTLPFDFEGARRREQAQEGLAALKSLADAVVCLPNQRLHAMLEPGTPLGEAFAFVDRMMGAGIRGLWTLLARDNMLNLDFSDLQTLVENSGNECCFGYGEGAGSDKAEQALRELLEGPMLEKGRVISNSGAMILSVTGGPDLALSELELVHRRFQEAARPGAHISMGAAVLEDWVGRLALTVLAAEHWIPPARRRTDKEKAAGGLVFDDEAPPAPPEERSRRARKGTHQPELSLENDRGRFKGVSPTIYDGEDLDIPTYLRRGVRIPT